MPTPTDAAALEAFRIRKWARENGFRIGTMGGIPKAIHAAYAAAHGEFQGERRP